MSFTTPLAFLLLLAIPYFVWIGKPRKTAVSKKRDWVSVAVRVIILLLIVFSLAGAQLVQNADELAVVFLVDASDSISAEQAEQAEQFVRAAIETMGPSDQAAVIQFGDNALVDRPMSRLAQLAPLSSVPQALQTDIAAAIRLGIALFPAGTAKRMVILSDGAATLGNSDEAAKLAEKAGIEISTIPLTRQLDGAEALLTNVSAPTQISEGELFSIEITAESTANMPATLRVLSGGQVIYEDQVQLQPGLNNFAVRLRGLEQEFARYRVQLTPSDDTYYQNNELAAFTEVTGSPRVLLVANDGTIADDGTPKPDESPQLQLALEATGLDVDKITPTDLPASLAQLSNYASVVLVNINAKDLSPRKMEVLQSYVRDLGGGLVAVGGPESYGMGGYFKTPLEELLPVEMQIRDQERFPSVSMVIVIDRSGSMGADEGGVTKIQLAAEGAVRVVELLNDFDEITVIPVDTGPTGQIGPVSIADRETAIEQIRQIGAGGGGIYVRTGLEAAAEALSQSPNQVKHIILLADGSDSEEKEGVPELIEALTAENVTLTTVSIGSGPDLPWLREMAALGNGRFHFTDRAANLPQIFTQETTNIQRSYLIEERFFPELVTSSPILAGISAVPPLYGYVGAYPKDTAQVILGTPQGDPLLAAWQYGLGRSVAWTSDATGRWGTDWVQWEGFPAFWAQAVRWTISDARDSRVETSVLYDDQTAVLTVNAQDVGGEFLNNVQMEANVVAPNGEVENVTLQQVAPGQYQAEFTPTSDGAYFIRVAGTDGTSEEAVVGQTSGWVLSYSPEYSQFESNPQLLEALAETTNGQDLSLLNVAGGDGNEALTAVFAHNLTTEATTRLIWPWLILIATLLLPLDIALRRLVITKSDWQRAWAASFGRFASQKVEPAPRTQQMSSLFDAKERAGVKRPSATADTAIPQPIQTEDASKTKAEQTTSTPPKTTPTPQHKSPPSSTQSGGKSSTLASQLLKKKKQQNQDDD